MFELLDKLPLNNYKSVIGVVLYVIVVGLWGIDRIDVDTALYLINAISLWTGVALAHKVDKAKRGL